MKITFKDTATAWEIAQFIDTMEVSTKETPLSYNLYPEDDLETLVLNIRAGDFDKNILNDDIIKEVIE